MRGTDTSAQCVVRTLSIHNNNIFRTREVEIAMVRGRAKPDYETDNRYATQLLLSVREIKQLIEKQSFETLSAEIRNDFV